MPVCGLCKKEADLRRSHIIPAFVFRWLKETSATGHLRAAMNPHKRAQDGLKAPMLCEECEQRFSRLERQFANEIFYPIQRGEVEEVHYGPWFLKFCVSISWRVFNYAIQHDRLTHLSEAQRQQAHAASDRWAQFLLDEVPHPGRYEQRVVLLGAVERLSGGFPPNANRYFMRGIEMDVAAAESSAFTYAKLGPFALFGMVEASERWDGTKVNANEGTVGPKEYTFPESIFDYWADRARRHHAAYRRISQEQQDKLEADIIKNPERFLKSGTFEAMRRDVEMFGNAAHWQPKPRRGDG